MSLDTTQSQIQTVLEHLREIFVHVDTTEWREFLAIAEELNLATIGALETAGIKLAEFRDMGREIS